MINFFMNNYEWMFSGVISGLIFWFLGQKRGYNKAIKQNQNLLRGGTGIQVGGDYTNINNK